MKCKICGNTAGNEIYDVKEMMFGYNDFFDYFKCSKCGCLQIAEIPIDMQKYYPLEEYYSFQHPDNFGFSKIRTNFAKMRNRYVLTGKGIIGLVLTHIFPAYHLEFLKKINVTCDVKILDVGCGSGALLKTLGEIGFRKLYGIDPYIKENIEYKNGIKILKKQIHELDDEFDVILFNHSFEHIPDPKETLETVSKLLSENGICIIRIPTVSSFAWKEYNVNWVQLDAPRHFFLYSLDSIKYLALKSELIVNNFYYDSTDFQFWGSEQYLRGIPLRSSNSYAINPHNSFFSRREIKLFKKKAKELNIKNQGDQLTLYLSKNDFMESISI